MPQLSLYVDNETMGLLRAGSQREGVSLSNYASQLIRGDVKASWPHGFWDVYGSLDDDTFGVPDELDFALDGPRAQLWGASCTSLTPMCASILCGIGCPLGTRC